MKKETKEILLRFDEIGQFETPKKFSFNNLKLKTTQLTKQLNEHFLIDFPIDYGQDASFFCEIKMSKKVIEHFNKTFRYVIRISNFGNLATLNFEDNYSEIVLSEIIIELNKAGFYYISEEELEEKYDGNFKKLNDILQLRHDGISWWTRYFDYL